MNSTAADTGIAEKVTQFLEEIGIRLHFQSLEGYCFLPGIQIINGEMYIDRSQLKYPGDILHEAGHIAVVPSGERQELNETTIGERSMREAEEMMAIAWSYAACVHLNIDPRFVFHDEGYQQGGGSIVENFSQGHYFGVPMLQWTGMALERPDPEDPGKKVYPSMLKWMRD